MARGWCRRISAKAVNWRRLVVATAFCTAVVTLLFSCTMPHLLAHLLLRPDDGALPTYTVGIATHGTASPVEGFREPFPPPPPPVTSVPVLQMDRTSGYEASKAVVVTPPGVVDSPVEELPVLDSRPIVRSPSIGSITFVGRSSRPQLKRRPPWLLPPDQALAYAKQEIAHAPPVGSDDPELYAPLFRNVSVFKRSYELMERILKVYVYRDGAKPIFHTPPIKGIYASEGWFMKLIERNRQFVTKDPDKAHLFYLPYSARQLELALYVPNKHNMQQLSLFLKNYVNTIASKYPFWNRTHGSDHFLVACHDWGPYTTKEHDELFRNAIKALCNADVSEGIFVHGRDVSLPETTIAIPRRPLRGLGGRPVSQRTILAFFAGYMHGRVRPVLLKFWSGKDEDMRIYGPLPKAVSTKMSYAQHMKSSKFCICPMGFEVNSPRIVEAIYYECVPVIIADNFVPPFDDVLDWSRFSVVVEEKDIPNLKDILLKISFKQYVSMQRNVRRLQKHFLWHAKPVRYDIFHMILHSVWFSRLNHITKLG